MCFSQLNKWAQKNKEKVTQCLLSTDAAHTFTASFNNAIFNNTLYISCFILKIHLKPLVFKVVATLVKKIQGKR